MEGIEENDQEEFITIRFITKHTPFVAPDESLLVPKTISAPGLNKLLIEILQKNSPPVKCAEFDFIILGKLLRLPIIEHMTKLDASDDAIEIEYINKIFEQEMRATLPHDDWIGGVQIAGNWVLTGCYDNTVHLWNITGKHIISDCGHTNAIKGVSWLNTNNPSEGFISVSHDSTGILWQCEPNEMTYKSDNMTWNPRVILKGHERGINAVVVSPDSQNVATGGWDTFIKIWSASFDADEDYEPSVKKNCGTGIKLITRTPLHTLKGHKECIVAIQWIEPQTICTASMDHKMKFWDIESNRMHNEILTEKAFLGASWSPLSRTVISCFADKHIRLYDPRTTEGSSCKSTFTSHSLWVSAVKWSPTDEHIFMSGSYDQTVKLWDTRFPKDALFNVMEHEGKVLCLDWSNPKYYVAGWTDNNVTIYKNKSFDM